MYAYTAMYQFMITVVSAVVCHCTTYVSDVLCMAIICRHAVSMDVRNVLYNSSDQHNDLCSIQDTPLLLYVSLVMFRYTVVFALILRLYDVIIY